MSRKICVVSGSRADYGLLRFVMEGIRSDPGLALQVAVTGMHLSPEFGLTYREVEADGFVIDAKVDIGLESDTPAGIAKSLGAGVAGFGERLGQLRPDMLLVLGDRFEILAAVAAALVARIPVAHLHGGETSEGAFDEAIRHSITKMSHVHFVAAEEYRRRVIQLGENPASVHTVGGLGVDAVRRLPLLERKELEEAIGLELGARNLLVTFHPVTLEEDTAGPQMTELLAALEGLEATTLIFTMPNADTGGRVLSRMIEAFVAGRPNTRAYASLGQLRYLSCLRHVDGVVGNSSSGLIEAPAFHKGTVNIGDRQKGRIKADSVIDCAPDRRAIGAALEKLYSQEFQTLLKTVRNPYGDGGASELVVAKLASLRLDGIVKKTFFDLPNIDRIQLGS